MGLERPFQVDRRGFLKATAWSAVAGSAALSGCASASEAPPEPTFDPEAPPEPTFDPGAVPLDEGLFDLGVQSGLAATGVVLWTHVSADVELRARVWTSSGVLVLDEPILPEGGFVKLVVEGLEAGTDYDYAFVRQENDDDVSRSIAGSVRTPPEASDLAPLTLAASACTHPSRMPFRALEATATHDFDLFCHLGDISYNDDAFDRPTYDQAWATTLGDPGYRALLPRAAMIPTIDDHEIANNSIRLDLPPEHYAAGLAAIFDHLPLDGAPGSRLWSSHKWGATAEIFTLDSRTERRPDEGLYLSAEQLQWLIDGLASSTSHFKILLNSVPLSRFPPGWPGYGDRWEGYPDQREALLDAITEGGIENVWSLTGDLHAGLVNRVEREGPRAGLYEIMVGPGGPRTLNVLPTLVELAPDQAEIYFPSDQFIFRSGELSVTLLTFDPVANTVRVRFLDPETGEARYDEVLQAAGA